MRQALAGLFAIVGACSPPQESAPANVTVAPEQATASPVDEAWSNFEWLSGDEDGRAWLYFGPDESDNIHMHFECVSGSGTFTAEAFDPRREGVELVLLSGDTRGVFASEPVRDETGEFFGNAVKSRAQIAVTEPVISAFRTTGVLSAGAPPTAFRTAAPAELARIQRFFALCERG